MAGVFVLCVLAILIFFVIYPLADLIRSAEAKPEVKQVSTIVPPIVLPIVTEPKIAECFHDWLVRRQTVMGKNFLSFVKPEDDECRYLKDLPQERPSFIIWGGSFVEDWYSRIYPDGMIPVEKSARDAVCRKCDKTDLSYTMMITDLKSKVLRDKALFEELKKSSSDMLFPTQNDVRI